MIRCRCLGILFLFVVLSLAWCVCGQAPSGAAEQRSVPEASQATVTSGFDGVPSERSLSDSPPELSPEEVKRLEDALQRTHLPGPPLPVEPRLQPEALGPTSPPTPLPWPAELSPASERAADPSSPSEPAQDIIFFRNQDLGSGAPSSNTSQVNEPSVANSGTVVFMTGNWYAALSRNDGQTFTFVDPFTEPPPFQLQSPNPISPRFCCDQVVIYAPSVNAIFWLRNYIATPARGNVNRIYVDQGANGTWDCFYDFDPNALPGASSGGGDSFDFPDLVLGSNFLYHTANVFNQDSFTRAVINRYPLRQMAACVPQSMIMINSSFISSTAFSFRATHGAGTTIYWGAHFNTRTLLIFGWAEGCSSVSCISIDARSVDPWMNGRGFSTCPGPDNLDWCGRTDGRILGAYVANGVIGFLWDAAQGGDFPYPHVRFARFRESDRSLLSQGQIWNPRFAVQFPSVAVNSRGHLGGTILTGGGDFFPSCNAWIADDINGGVLAPLDLRNVVGGTSGPTVNVSGDYLTARPHAVFPNTWIGTCFSLQGGGRNSNTRPRFVWFGRQRDTP